MQAWAVAVSAAYITVLKVSAAPRADVIGWQGGALRSGGQEQASTGGWVMRVVQLSDHPGAMLQEVSQRRLVARERAQAQFEGALAQHHLRVEDAQRARDQARAQHRWWAGCGAWLR
jgi:hypothetical protein